MADDGLKFRHHPSRKNKWTLEYCLKNWTFYHNTKTIPLGGTTIGIKNSFLKYFNISISLANDFFEYKCVFCNSVMTKKISRQQHRNECCHFFSGQSAWRRLKSNYVAADRVTRNFLIRKTLVKNLTFDLVDLRGRTER